ncbi:3-keto-5-aminohexanoate cleavage protein [Methylobacterium aquaticum]|uniref:3-Keto-5-aminohexanoate cleavage protein n=1 Tax=Methylobacterium aquaticum TaxID=270351 RepID=A0A0C6FAY5_9HYPH|nr:3-keto-5-aminohexanoate cleavage protein [Methylobacterium aquaticum]BAQ49906.1 3-Keto-5-aminohexanoate cleavage protein [Methylobacterium aquaticum]
MRRADKVIISCAVTGSIHTPSMSPHLPVTPDEIADQAVGAVEAGAAIVHLHAREPETGKPTQDTAVYRQFLPRIAERCDGIVNITTGAGLGMSMDERLAAANWAKPEIASMNMGSFNFNISGAGARVGAFRHPWEQPYLASTTSFILSNTFDQIERGMRELGEHGTRFEFECYDVGHLYNLAHCVSRGLVKPPFFIQCIFGILGGIGPDPENLMHMKATADRLFGNDYYLSVLGAGRHQFPLVTMSAILGGNVRVGLEDNLYLGRGQLATSNADGVRKVRRILEELSLEIATPDEARAMLETKGRRNVGF